MTDTAALLGLFLSAFLAATLVPAGSEAVLIALILAGDLPVAVLLAVASVGNILGSAVNYTLGRGAAGLRGKRWFPVSDAALVKAESWYHRWGRWSLLLSWVPIIGDPITVAAGALRERFAIFLTLVTIAKTGRYLAVAAAVTA